MGLLVRKSVTNSKEAFQTKCQTLFGKPLFSEFNFSDKVLTSRRILKSHIIY
jgi:hypothetical protein